MAEKNKKNKTEEGTTQAKLKEEIFDLLEQQQVLQFKINELEKIKAKKYNELNELRQNGE